MTSEHSSFDTFADTAHHRRAEPYMLELYIAGFSPLSQSAITTINIICEQYLSGRYELKIIDIYQQPNRAASAGIIAVPTLIRIQPQPIVRLIGDFSDTEHVLSVLNIARKLGEQP